MAEQDENDRVAEGIHLEAEQEWSLDVVCGMEVDPRTTKFQARYNGEPYYFCNHSCMTHFINNPANYVG